MHIIKQIRFYRRIAQKIKAEAATRFLKMQFRCQINQFLIFQILLTVEKFLHNLFTRNVTWTIFMSHIL